MFDSRRISAVLVLFSIGPYDAHSASLVNTTLEKSVRDGLFQAGSVEMANVPTPEDIEARKASRNLTFAVVYSGQVCHGRGADVLWHPANMEKLWRNQVEMLHDPLRTWGEVHVFGLFEEAAPPQGKDSPQERNKAAGCNDFARLANWTGLEFMPSELGIHRNERVVNHGEQRRAMVSN
jgi:hypothetical protein